MATPLSYPVCLEPRQLPRVIGGNDQEMNTVDVFVQLRMNVNPCPHLPLINILESVN